MTEIVDDIMTPGCPQCAIKHLSAAIAWMSTAGIRSIDDVLEEPFVLVARAKINFVESKTGYKSHWHLAIGLLEMAEEFIAAECSAFAECFIAECRAARLSENPLKCAVFSRVRPSHMAVAHFIEAARELRECAGCEMSVDAAVEEVGRIRREWFDFPAPVVGDGGDNKQKGGQ